MPKIGVLSLDFPDNPSCVDRFRHGLGELGYVEGRTVVLDLRWAKDRVDLLPGLAADLVRSNVDVIVSASGPAAAVVKDATRTIPIVLASSFYPVEAGIIQSLAHPGGNVTGVTHFTPELMAKRVQLIKELLPKTTRIAVLRLPGRLQDLVVRDMTAAARQLGIELQPIEVRREEDLATAFETAAKGRAQAVMSTSGVSAASSRSSRSNIGCPVCPGSRRLPTLGPCCFTGPTSWKAVSAPPGTSTAF